MKNKNILIIGNGESVLKSKLGSDIDKFVGGFVLSIIKNAPIAIKAAKKSINSAFIDLGFNAEREQYLKTLKSEDRNEGLSSFKDKRDPNWKNK